MLTTTLIKKADIRFILPANISVEEMKDIPVEALIEIQRDGTIEIEGMRFSNDDRDLNDLVNRLEVKRNCSS